MENSLLPLLKCNACQKSNLIDKGNSLVCAHCGQTYRVIQGKAVMYDNEAINGIERGDSHEVPWRLAELLADVHKLGLNLGAGNSIKPRPNIINVDYLLYKNGDLAVDAHNLPFPDGVFDVVASFNVFEHLNDPLRASKEIFRVLKPGGKLIIHTAFLQPLHMEPHHYFNATEHGIRYWFKQFDVERVEVSPNFSPLLNLAWIASIIQAGAKGLVSEDKEKIGQMTLNELAQFWRETSTGKKVVWDSEIFHLSQKLPASTKKSVGGGFELEATRPDYGRNSVGPEC